MKLFKKLKDSSVQASEKNSPADSTPLLEWIVAGLGLVLLGSVLSFLVFDALANRPAAPPEVAVQVLSMESTGNGYRALFRAVNRGGESVQGLVIYGEIRRSSEIIERSWVTFDYLPAGAEKRGGLFFTHDARGFELVIRPLGYEQP